MGQDQNVLRGREDLSVKGFDTPAYIDFSTCHRIEFGADDDELQPVKSKKKEKKKRQQGAEH
jgi:hypothetical protein